MSEKIQQYGTYPVTDYFVNLQVWGTPEQCYEKILDIHARTGNSHYVGVFSYAGMPYDEAERSMRLFAREVAPALQKRQPGTAAPRVAASAERPVNGGVQGTRLPDDLLSLGGMAMQALWWEGTSGHCPRCGEDTERLEGEWGKRCPRCRYEHYPHLHPAVIVMVRDGSRCLLARKAGWAPGRYALVAGFVDNGESLEGAVRREVKEEVGVDVKDIEYVGSQNWPFPSQP